MTISRIADRALLRWTVVLLAAGMLTMALAMVLADSAPQPPPTGPTAAPLVAQWALRLTTFLSLAAGVASLAGALLATEQVGGHTERQTGLRVVLASSTAMIALSGVEIVLTAWQTHAVATPTRPYSIQTVLGSAQSQGLLVQIIICAGAAALAAVMMIPSAYHRSVCVWILPLTMAAFVPPLLTGHVRTANLPLLAGLSLVAHVLAAGL